MKYRPFGSTDLSVSELCFATSNFARYLDQGQAFAMLDAFRAAGGNFFETTGSVVTVGAGSGLNALSEEFFARWFHARAIPRREVVLAVRIAPRRCLQEDDESFAAAVQTLVHASLRRIGTDHLDLLIVDWHDSLLPLRRNLPAIEAAAASGAARHVVLASFPTEHVDVAQRLLPRSLAGLQCDYSLLQRNVFARGTLAMCRNNGLGFVARAPLAGGHLVAWPAPPLASFAWRNRGDPFIATAAHALAPKLSAVARHHSCSPARVALGWVLAQRDVTAVRISTRTIAQTNELLAATDLPLSNDEIAALESRRHLAETRRLAETAPEAVEAGGLQPAFNSSAHSARHGAPLGLLFA